MPLHRSKPELRIIHGLARCGGTMINRCLGSMQDITVISEINPKFRFMGLKALLRQAQDWFGLIGPIEARLLRLRSRLSYEGAFIAALRRIARRAAHQEATLVVRDWNHPDFVGVPFTSNPSMRSSLYDLASEAFTIRRLAVMRHPVDQYLSSVSRAELRDVLDPETFLRGHAAFAEYCREIPWIRYEDYTRDARKALQGICDQLSAPYDPGWEHRWMNYHRLTGDVDQPDASRALTSQRIDSMPRRATNRALLQRMRSNPDYRKSLELLGYDDVP